MRRTIDWDGDAVTIASSLATGAEIAIEERAPDELRMFTGTHDHPAGRGRFQPGFRRDRIRTDHRRRH